MSDVSLNRKQKLAAEIMAAEPLTSGAEIARRVEVDVNTFYRWKKNPEWVEYVHTCCVEEFKEIEKIAVQKLKENTMKGNQKAIEYLLDYLEYKSPDTVEIKDKVIKIEIEE